MGPTGAMLACELSLAGIGVTVIDKLTELPAHSKEVGVPVRVVEILEQRGLLASVEARANAKLPDAHFGQLPVSLPYDGWQARHPSALGLPHLTLGQGLEARLAGRVGVGARPGDGTRGGAGKGSRTWWGSRSPTTSRSPRCSGQPGSATPPGRPSGTEPGGSCSPATPRTSTSRPTGRA